MDTNKQEQAASVIQIYRNIEILQGIRTQRVRDLLAIMDDGETISVEGMPLVRRQAGVIKLRDANNIPNIGV